jgi:hypothetical protein
MEARRTPRAKRLAGAGLAGIAALVCAVAIAQAATPAHSSSPGQPPPAETLAANRAAAYTDANQLLQRVVLPAGATQSSTEPAGDHGMLGKSAVLPLGLKAADDHAWWTVPGTLADAATFEQSHSPAGGKSSGSGSEGGGKPARTIEDFVTFNWPPVGRTLGTRELVVSMVQLPADVTGVRVDAIVQWIVPRPVAEAIPTQARVLDVTVGVPHQQPAVSLTVTGRRKVQDVAALIDGLEIAQPTGPIPCPAILSGTPEVTFVFRATRTGPVLARATALANLQATGPCFAMTLSIRGHDEDPLSDAPDAIRGAQHLLDVRLARG